MKDDSLLAKSPQNGCHKTLVTHTRDVVDAATSLFGSRESPTRLANCWTRFFRIPDFSSFLSCLHAAAATHDIGKANKDFQQAVRGGQAGQLLRHEHLSGLMLMSDSLETWIFQRSDVDWDIVLAAVVCHHLKADPDSELCVVQASRDKGQVDVYTHHRDFKDLLKIIGSHLGIPGMPEPVPTLWVFDKHPPPQCLSSRAIARSWVICEYRVVSLLGVD